MQGSQQPITDLTPLRSRGKKGNRRIVKSSASQVSAPQNPSKSKLSRAKPRKATIAAMPTLQGLPQELLEMIFLYSMNISLPRASPDLGRRLSSKAVCLEYCMRTFFATVDHRNNHRTRKKTSDPVVQSDVLTCQFYTWPFFLSYVEKAHDAIVKLRGKAWASTGVTVPGQDEFEGLWPYRFSKITYLSFAEGFYVPEKLLHGPWTEEKVSLLYILVSLNGKLDWEGSIAGETAKEGLKEAIEEGNERAVAALSVLLGVSKALTTGMLRLAVIDCGCEIRILRHLLFNAQILADEVPDDTLNFHDAELWKWIDRERSDKSEWLKEMLRNADKFSFNFYCDETSWQHIVPFPYSGPRFDPRANLGNSMAGEMLKMLYRNHAQIVEMGDADITTSQWRLVEVGRVVTFGNGPYEGRQAVIVEIVDHKRVLVDGPSKDAPVPRHSASLTDVSLTSIVIPKLPRAAGRGFVAKQWEQKKVEEQYAQTTWAKKRAQFQKRRQLTDFERFKVLKLRKQTRYEVRKTLAGIRAKA
ncbi:hypothetical protein BU24DRAFT_440370 [Aaosphaeria arxii CBS 175.79]|uniref:Large ribosomal subunit protein eL14 domain-containing protein n=1 Tax=Aaosphaeria arxii CBS 175.79 TaxID=1450172 RepID=A0A6A5XVN9_9PLEO|nr:uncharacterized protein BU24DRAFT_440370 [Aaosphaeria arxii CBS 175.79]KAF2017375.1 hypothetical protein BU24DRAFT_440370 [Aaosphaeria arxii CBS 175.79]